MWPRGVLVHSCLIYLSSFHSLLYKLQQLLLWFHIQLSKTINENTCLRVLSNLQSILILVVDPWNRSNFPTYLRIRISHRGDWGTRLLSVDSSLASIMPESWCWSILLKVCIDIQQICYLLHINFKKWDSHTERTFNWILLDVVKDVVHASWHKTILENRFLRSLTEIRLIINWRFTSKYGMCLPRTCLSICHYHSIESIKDVLNDRFSNLLIRKCLIWFTIEHTIKEEVSSVILLALQLYLLPRDIVNDQAICLSIQILLLSIDRRYRLAF
jgi:hypothetical protein